MKATEIIGEQLMICDTHIAVAREWLVSQLRSKGFESDRTDIDHDRDGWKIWLRVRDGEPFRQSWNGASDSWHCARGDSLRAAFHAAAAAIEAITARDAYDAWFALEQTQAPA